MYRKSINNLEQTFDFFTEIKIFSFMLMGIFVIWNL